MEDFPFCILIPTFFDGTMKSIFYVRILRSAYTTSDIHTFVLTPLVTRDNNFYWFTCIILTKIALCK